MKWFTCLNEDGLDKYADNLRIALASAEQIGAVDAHLIYDGDPSLLRKRLHDLNYTVHSRRSRFWRDIVDAPDIPGYRHRIATGAFLRFEIPDVECDDTFVLYTDCDVMFTRRVDLTSLRPAYLAAAPELKQDDWSYFNSGVLLLNLPALRGDLDRLGRYTRTTLGDPKFVYDQGVLNHFYADNWSRLPLTANWKPYWGVNDEAMIVHFHGPKIPALEVLIEGKGSAIVHDVWRDMYKSNVGAYEKYYAQARSFLQVR